MRTALLRNIKLLKVSKLNNFLVGILIAGFLFFISSAFVQAQTVDKSLVNLQKIFNKPIKIVFSDIDGTVKEKEQKVPKNTLAAINLLKQNKIIFVYVTGRTLTEVQQMFVRYGLPKADYYILENGARITDSRFNDLYYKQISRKDSLEVIDVYEKYSKINPKAHLFLNAEEKCFCASEQRIIDMNLDILAVKTDSIKKLVQNNRLPDKMLIFQEDSFKFSQMAPLKEYFSDNIKSKNLDVSVSTPYYCEIINKDSAKGPSIERLSKKLKIDLQYSVAIGDGENDISMINTINKHKGLTIAMGNGQKKLKEESKIITDDIQHDGYLKAVVN